MTTEHIGPSLTTGVTPAATVARRVAGQFVLGLSAVAGLLLFAASPVRGSEAQDRATLLALDKQYQQAVKDNDAKTMAALLAEDFVVVEGDGKHFTKADLLKSATDGSTHYEHQEDSQQSVRLYGDTAVVTALLWVKGLEDGQPVNYRLWFSDVYVRTAAGWRYVFGQASLPLPAKAH